MANWSNPTLSSLYTDFLTEVKNRDVDLALGFDGISPTPSNLPTGAIRWDSSAGRWKKWTGSAWGELAATYALTAVSTTGDITVGGAIVFEGATANDYETTLTVVDPTADRTITLPNVTGTVVTTGDSGTVTSAMIADGTIVNGDISATAAIAGSKISPDFGSQNTTTTGTSTAASFIPSSATVPTNGIYLPTTNTVAISTSGTGKVFVDSTGKVGVGISPSQILDIYRATAGQAIIKLSDADSRSVEFRSPDNTGAIAGIGSTTNHDFAVFTNNVEKIRITSTGDVNIKGAGTAGSTQAVSFSGSAPVNSLVVQATTGNVGLGTGSPSQLFTVNGTGGGSFTSGYTNTLARINATTNTAGQGAAIALTALATKETAWIIAAEHTSGNNGDLAFYGYPGGDSYGERLRITAAGNLGLGVVPSAWSGFGSAEEYGGKGNFVGGNSVAMYVGNNAYYSSGWKYVNSAAAGYYYLYAGEHIWTTAPSGTAGNPITFTQAMTLDASGRLLVGTTSDSGGALLQVNGDRVRIATAKTPASATATGTTGEVCWDANYVYVCTATNTWKRAAIATW